MELGNITTKALQPESGEKRISFVVRKEKRGNATYVVGLEHFIADTTTFRKRVCQKLGTGFRLEQLDPKGTTKTLGFNGNLVDNIYSILLELGIDKNNIKK